MKSIKNSVQKIGAVGAKKQMKGAKGKPVAGKMMKMNAGRKK